MEGPVWEAGSELRLCLKPVPPSPLLPGSPRWQMQARKSASLCPCKAASLQSLLPSSLQTQSRRPWGGWSSCLFHLLCRLMTTEETNQNTGFGEAYFIDIVKDSKL